MKVLIVCSCNFHDFEFSINQAFIFEQSEALANYFGIQYETFFIKGKGIFGYLTASILLRKFLKYNKFDVIHAHFGLSGLCASLQRSIPVVITFHSGEVLTRHGKYLSSLASLLSTANICVNRRTNDLLFFKNKNNPVIPCGIDMEKSLPIKMYEARKLLGFAKAEHIILFGGSIENTRKNFELLNEAIRLESTLKNVNIIELKGFRREQVTLLLNACNVMVLPSLAEGSPQIIKEAMACNCPIVATDVGDIREVIGDTEGCYITSFDPADVAEKIKLALAFGKRTNGREKIGHLDNKIIAEKIMGVYKSVLMTK